MVFRVKNHKIEMLIKSEEPSGHWRKVYGWHFRPYVKQYNL